MKRNPRTDPPKAGVIVNVHGSDFRGEYMMQASRRDYVQKSNVRSFCDNGIYWNFRDSHGDLLTVDDVESWSEQSREMV